MGMKTGIICAACHIEDETVPIHDEIRELRNGGIVGKAGCGRKRPAARKADVIRCKDVSPHLERTGDRQQESTGGQDFRCQETATE